MRERARKKKTIKDETKLRQLLKIGKSRRESQKGEIQGVDSYGECKSIGTDVRVLSQ
jgi:hypothetical protein